MIRALFAAVAIAVAVPAHAASEEDLSTLYDALKMADGVSIVSQEGLDYAQEIEADMFPGRGGDRWQAIVAQIYDEDRLNELTRDAMRKYLGDQDVTPMLAFLQSDLGSSLMGLEVSARIAIQDEAVEEAAIERAAQMEQDGDPRWDQLSVFIEVNDLVEFNVMGALNSNFEFFRGLADGGAFPEDMNEADMLSQVWSEEAEIRDSTTEWMYGYLALAYGPVTDADLDTYIDFSQTEAGRALNSALFDAFDVVYRVVSRELGLAVSQFMVGEDI